MSRRRAISVLLGACLLCGLFFAASALAAGGPEWKVTVIPNADYFLSSGAPSGNTPVGSYKVEAENVGGSETSEEVKIRNVIPAGLVAKAVRLYYLPVGTEYVAPLRGIDQNESEEACTVSAGEVECKLPTPTMELLPLYCSYFHVYCGVGPGVAPGQRVAMIISVEVPPGTEGSLEDIAQVSEGGGVVAEGSSTNEASAEPAFGMLGFGASVTDAGGAPYMQAGGHPYQFTTEFNFATFSAANESSFSEYGTAPLYDPKDITSELPPGLIANPQGVPHCSLADYFVEECEKTKVAVGTACLRAFIWTEGACRLISPVFNLEPHGSFPGELGITVGGAPFIILTTSIRDGGNYGVTANDVGIQAGLSRVRLTLWGVPADETHNALRGKSCGWIGATIANVRELEAECETPGFESGGGPAEVPPTPFLTMPTECSGNPLTVIGRYDSWDFPGEYATGSASLSSVDGCENLQFAPTIEVRPTTNLADAPSGLEFNLHVPQNEDPEGVATPELRESVVKLPVGVSINPPAAEGLGGCSEAEVGLHSGAPANCPDASKLGGAEVLSPLLNEPLKGSLFLATPHQNPSDSLLASYLEVEGQGVRIKLPGSFETDPQTGQITARFLENPQLPFEELKLDIFGGASGALRTPAVCGSYETTSSLTPFSAPQSGPPATPSSTFETSAGPDGQESSCLYGEADLPNAPRFHAGTEAPQAGIYSPFSLKLVREDGSQEVTGVETTLPEGLVGRLAGIPYCPEAAIAAAATKKGAEEQANPSCPAASEVGSVEVAAGAGPTPIDVAGHVYLAGPYKGAPLSVAIITPALAGPFDLGTVAVRAGLYVNPQTTQITAKSDPIPHILEGIPLDIRAVTLKLNRPSFTRNPTSCEELAFGGQATSLLGARAPLTQRFQVGGCNALSFKPKLALQLKGATGRTGHPALTAILKMPEGGANIASAQVTLPSSEIVDNAHIGDVCTATEFAAGNAPGERCKPTSIYGRARAWSPLLEAPLEGPVFLKTPGHKLPDLLAALNGQIDVALEGKVDSSPKGGLRNTFEVVPDAPVSKFVLEMKGGKKGLLENNQPICAHPEKATALFSAHNGAAVELNPRLKIRCHKHKKHRRHHHRGGRRRG